MMDPAEHAFDDDKSGKDGKSAEGGKDDELNFDFDKIVTALPLPLEGVGAKL